MDLRMLIKKIVRNELSATEGLKILDQLDTLNMDTENKLKKQVHQNLNNKLREKLHVITL